MKQHLIFTSGRSGSNYLSNTLNMSPDCVNYGEVLGEWTLSYKLLGRFLCNDDLGAKKYLKYVYSSKTFFLLAQIYSAYSHRKAGRSVNYKTINNISSIGIKDFLVTMEKRKALDFFKAKSDIKVIYLYRSNFLKKYISTVYRKNSRIAASYSNIKVKPLNVDIPHMLSNLEIMMDESVREKAFISSLDAHEVLHIEYESYFKSNESIVFWNHKIFEFLGVTPVETKSEQKKILPDSLKETVLNNEEVVEVLMGTKYEGFLY